MTAIRPVLALLALLAHTGCVAPTTSDSAYLMTPALPPMGWDHRPEAQDWTTATLATLADHDGALGGSVPEDIVQWCPGYAQASLEDRRAFWSGLLSAIAKYESAWNPEAAGGGGRYLGLMQISPKTASHYDCQTQDATGLKDGSANLSCAVTIIAAQVDRDGMVAGDGNRGLARDWGPLKRAETRDELAAWTSAQSYCQ